jgi:hypothetical protein
VWVARIRVEVRENMLELLVVRGKKERRRKERWGNVGLSSSTTPAGLATTGEAERAPLVSSNQLIGPLLPCFVLPLSFSTSSRYPPSTTLPKEVYDPFTGSADPQIPPRALSPSQSSSSPFSPPHQLPRATPSLASVRLYEISEPTGGSREWPLVLMQSL